MRWFRAESGQERRAAAELRPAQEVHDKDDEQNDHEEPDQSIAGPCDCERHAFSLVACRVGIPIVVGQLNLTTGTKRTHGSEDLRAAGIGEGKVLGSTSEAGLPWLETSRAIAVRDYEQRVREGSA